MSHAAERLLHQTIEHLRLKTDRLEGLVRLLESENQDLARQLKEAGGHPRMPVLSAERLPPPLAEPDGAAIGDSRERMTPAERRLFEAVCGSDGVLTVFQSETRAEVGLWLIERRVWVVVTSTEVVLLAAGRRPLAQGIAFPHLHASLYNPVTGELVLAPDRGFRVGRVKLPPLESNQVLAQIVGAQTPGNEGSE
ncbi:MAG: hypothetical protein WCG36_03255 [bacterium]